VRVDDGLVGGDVCRRRCGAEAGAERALDEDRGARTGGST
jgi:hypothetical protein